MFTFLLLILNLLCMLASWIWTIVLGFKTSVLWGFLNMIPFVGFVWMIMHQEEAKGPAKLFVSGFVCMFINWKVISRGMRIERAVNRMERAEANRESRNTTRFDGDEVILDDSGPSSGDEEEDEESAGMSESGTGEEEALPGSAATASAAGSPPDANASAPASGTVPGAAPAGNAAVASAAGSVDAARAAGTVTALASAPRANSVYIEDAPIDTIWTQYYTAVSHVQAGDPRGIREFEICLCADDAAWLRQNMTAMAELIVPGLMQTNPQEAQLTVLQTLLRNMPTTPPREKPEIAQSKAVAVARLTSDTPAGPQSYTTLLTQEAGRWVLVQPFFVRTFVWNPQLAQYKAANSLPLTFEEQAYMRGGFAPFQQQIRGVYAMVGYKGL